jgi:protein-disulfide isomerase/uncharacterized membrane protein
MAAPRSPSPPARGPRIAFLVLCTIGACLAADLIRLHVRVHTDPDYHSYCAISEQVDCETVAQSPQSVVAGLPTAVWGLLGYLFLGSLACWGLRTRLETPTWPFAILGALALFSTLVSLWLFAVSLLVIRSTCIVCVGTYVVNILLLVVAGWELRRSNRPATSALRDELAALRRVARPAVALIGVFAVAAGVLWASVPPYWRLAHMTGPGGLPVGRSADGHWWIGARNATLEITEFSDYQCPFCERGHAAIRALLRDHPEQVRIVHRNFPLDPACNPMLRKPMHNRACLYAALAHCAGEQGRFWEASDLMYARGRQEPALGADEMAAALGLNAAALQRCAESDAARAAVAADVRHGLELQIRGTPTFVIQGRTYPGTIPDDVIRAALKPAAAAERP